MGPILFFQICSITGIGDVVITGHEKEGHLQLIDKACKLIPLSVDLDGVGGISLDQIADAHHKLRLKQVDLFHSLFKNAGARTTGSIRNHDKLKLSGFVVDIKTGPWLGTCGLFDDQFRVKIFLLGRGEKKSKK